MQYLRELFFLLGDKKRALPLILFFFLCLSALEVAGIGIIGPYVSIIISDNVMEGEFAEYITMFGLPQEKERLLLTLGLILFLIFLIKTISTILMNRSVIWFGATLQVSLRSSLMESYQNMPYSIYLSRNSSEFVYAINNLCGTFQAVVTAFLKLISDLILIFAVLVLLALQDIVALSIFVLILGGLVFIYDKIFNTSLKVYGEKTNTFSAKLLKNLNEGLDGFKEIRVLGTERFFYHKVVQSAEQLAIFQTKETLLATSPRFLLELVMVSFIVLLVVITLYIGGELESIFVTLAMFSIAGLRLLPATSALSSNLVLFRFSRDAVSRLYKDFKIFEDIKQKKGKLEPSRNDEAFKNLELKDVHFSYIKDHPETLKDINISIKSGEAIGIMGPSGSGKTTLVDILLGLLKYDKGSLTYNNKPLDIDLTAWQSKVAYLPQEVFLLDDTIRNNVALGVKKEEIDNEKIHDSLKKSRLMEFVNDLPDGIDTLLGERGSRLSGGQRQRIALARSFYHEREVLVMDEATSALDAKTENDIVDEIKYLKGKQTLIIIAHRLTTLEHCDRIYVMGNGKIIDSGSPKQILS